MNNHICIICNQSNINQYFRLKANSLIALKCKRCGHVFIENSPINADNASNFYTMGDFKGQRKLQNKTWYANYYDDCFMNYEQKINTSLVLRQFKEKIDFFISRFPQGGRLLDIGCATGVFLDMIKKRGWDVEGVEISDELASYARNHFNLKVHVADLTKERLKSDPFHVITLFDVIEHLPNPNTMINACSNLLTKDGLLLLRTPTEEGLLRDIAKMIYWLSLKKIESLMYWFYSFEHIHSFSLSTITAILDKHNFSIIKLSREEESIERINIPQYIKIAMNGINFFSSLLKKQHKITVIAKKN